MNQWFAPTALSVTFEAHGRGKFTPQEIQQIVERDPSGKVVALHLPSKSVIISNHQVYCDWWYVWCLTYFTKAHRDVFIVLKKSLKWVPILGPGMQMFRFIFLARSWSLDQAQLEKKLSKLGKKAEKEDNPFALILFPEGTLVSRDTRPISRRYAEKLGIPDLNNTLLPRSTGLHYCLRSLAPRLPTLKLLDVTITYPGVYPPKRYGQSYYTLRSIFCDRIPPPVVHMHLRIFDVTRQVPIGSSDTCTIGDIPKSDKAKFDEWLRELWTRKDQFMTEFLERDVSNVSKWEPVQIPLELRSSMEMANAYCFFTPAIAIYALIKLAGPFLSELL
ncbi:acyltransferase-domain-containing protein [Scleroderma yunnanense]